MSTLKGSDDCTDTILDFIAGGVPGNMIGESKGNYNAVIGNANATIDLSILTLEQIHAIGRQRRNAGMPSTAMGRYQFLDATLRALEKSFQIDPDTTLFTPVLQDRLAVALLVGRGYPQWWRGAMTDREFAHNLSMEWASLPDPENDPDPTKADDEKSHYDGDSAGNHASTKLSAVYAMLQRAKALKGTAGSVPVAEPAPLPVGDNALDYAMQSVLALGGFYKGRIDGDWGPRSAAALREFEESRR